MSDAVPDRTFPFRIVLVVAVAASMFGAVLMFLLGVKKTLAAYAIFLDHLNAPLKDSIIADNKSIALMIQSIDAFMIGMVFIIFAYGITTLFIKKIHVAEDNVFSWVRITNINQLKVIVGEMIVIILFVKFLEIILLSAQDLTFEMLVLPVGIALLALALKFLDLDHREKTDKGGEHAKPKN